MMCGLCSMPVSQLRSCSLCGVRFCRQCSGTGGQCELCDDGDDGGASVFAPAGGPSVGGLAAVGLELVELTGGW